MDSSRLNPARFNKSYYDRFYRNASTRAVSPAQVRRQVAFIASYLRYLEIPVKRAVDLGCGLGRTLDALAVEYPNASLTGVEISDYLCQRFGWVQAGILEFTPKAQFDLVICNDVLSYLTDKDCAKAINHIAGLSRGAVFLGVPTIEDWDQCDPHRTDQEQVLRSTAWYRRRLNKHFVSVGGGLYLKKPVDVNVWSLDALHGAS